MPVSKSFRAAGTKLVVAAVGAALFGMAESAKADIILTQVSGPIAVAGGYDYTYDALLSFNSELNKSMVSSYPMFTTLYDAGSSPVAVSNVSGYLATDFTYTPETSTNAPAYRSTPVDSSSLYNIRFTYTGAVDPMIVGSAYTISVPGNPTLQIGTNPVDLGQFTIFSTYNTEVYTSFDGESETAFGSAAGAEQGNNSTTTVPGPVSVPEPASLAAIGFGAAGLIARRRRA